VGAADCGSSNNGLLVKLDRAVIAVSVREEKGIQKPSTVDWRSDSDPSRSDTAGEQESTVTIATRKCRGRPHQYGERSCFVRILQRLVNIVFGY
jgi:hypothetical protein